MARPNKHGAHVERRWHDEFLDERVQEEFRALPPDMIGDYARITSLLETCGPFLLREPHTKPLGEGLYEFRMSGRAGIARAIYVVTEMRRVVVVHVFRKKTQRTPARNLKLARRRAKLVK